MVDVKNKTCKANGCNTQANYNNKGETAGIYCSTHKIEGMVDVKNKTCKANGCNTQANYNNKGETVGIYCSTHKKRHGRCYT